MSALCGAGDNRLNIDPEDVITMSDTDELVVNGNAGDSVRLYEEPGQLWTLESSTVRQGIAYDVYRGTADMLPDAFILIQQGVTVEQF